MGNCVAVQNNSKQALERNSFSISDTPKRLVTSSSTPVCLSEETEGKLNIDQIALQFLNSSISGGATVRHSYPNTPQTATGTLVASHSSPTNGLINFSASGLAASNHPVNEDDSTQSFSNSSTPKIGGGYLPPHNTKSLQQSYNSARHSEYGLDSFKKHPSSTGRPVSIIEPQNSTYLTSVTGPEVQKPVMYQLSDNELLVALFDYNARDDEEVSLRKLDNLRSLDDSDEDWIFVENLGSGKKGYVPQVYVAQKGSVEAEDWFFFSISRKDSERLLLLRGNVEGTFLIRGSETVADQYSLSVHHNGTVNHYRVRKRDLGSPGANNSSPEVVFCLTSRQTFCSLQQMVEYYSEASNGLCCRLTRPCPRPPPVTSDLTRKTRDRWEISRTSIKLLTKLGSGNFGDVFQGKWNNTTDVAVKTLKPGTMHKDEFLKEARIMKKLSHPNLVRLYAVCSDDPIYIVTELMSKGSLLEYLRSDEGRTTSIQSQLDMMGQIANGMRYLEQEGYIHRDLAARNILIGESNVCKVADFGLTRIVHGSGDIYNARVGAKFPIKWTAPEAALMGKFTVKSDVWSYGIVLYEIITLGQTPFPAMNNTQTLQQVERGYRMPKPLNCPQEIYSIMLSCWDNLPDNRPSFGKLAEFFDDNGVNETCGGKYRPTGSSTTTPTSLSSSLSRQQQQQLQH